MRTVGMVTLGLRAGKRAGPAWAGSAAKVVGVVMLTGDVLDEGAASRSTDLRHPELAQAPSSLWATRTSILTGCWRRYREWQPKSLG